MILLLVTMAIRNLGMQVVVNETSKRERFWRKNYLGVEPGSSKIRRMMDKFPITLNM